MQLPLEVYRIHLKYIRNLHNIDDRVLSVSPQIGKDERPFLGVIVVCNEHKYCVPLSKPKKKHQKMWDKIDFTARTFSASFPLGQYTPSGLLSTPFSKSKKYLSGNECNCFNFVLQ